MKACALRLASVRDLQKERLRAEAKAKEADDTHYPSGRQAGWSKSEAGRRARVWRLQKRPAGCWQGASAAAARGAAAASRPQLAPGSRTLQSSGRPGPAAASEPHPRRHTTGGAVSPSRGLTQSTTGLSRWRRRFCRIRGDPVTSAAFIVPLAENESNVRKATQSAKGYFQTNALIGELAATNENSEH